MSNDKTFTRGDKVTYFGRDADGGEGMSDDLVSRLRRAVTWQGVVPHNNELAREAAAEIERLKSLAVRAWHSFRSGLSFESGCDCGLTDADIEELIRLSDQPPT